MHAINFALKRAHLCTVWVGQKMLDLVVPQMTPARFDLLYYVRCDALRKKVGRHMAGARDQSHIVQCLGLHKSTISKMLHRLEEIGWISRIRDCDDRRIKVVRLTKPGLRALGKAMRFLFRGRHLAKPYDRITRLFEPTESVAKAHSKIWATIDGIARFMGDTSSIWYEGGGKFFRTRGEYFAARKPDNGIHPYWMRAPIDRYLFELDYFISYGPPPRVKVEWFDPWLDLAQRQAAFTKERLAGTGE
jgi:DNA-binding MarR family transcriptional regulator